ncbi:retrovirus-related pol polyprotein from transposon TNT 1-94, partial [Tanacetum coccineum]
TLFDVIKPTYQVVLDALTLTTRYLAFLITADVPEIYMQQFWFTINKKDSTTYKFNIEKKSYKIDMEVFKEIFQIYPRLPNLDFVELLSDEEIVSFIKKLGHKEDIKSVTEVIVDQMYQPWRNFAAIINKCLSRKTTGLDKLRLLRAQILWGIFYKKNVDFVELLWEDLTFQIENIDHKKKEKMYYPRFTKAIIHHFISKDKSISMRNIIMTNQQMQDSDAYKTYLAYATGAASPKMKRKIKKHASPSKKRYLVTIEEEEPEPAKKVVSSKKPIAKRQSTGVRIRDTPGVSVLKKKAPAKAERSKGIKLLSDASLLKEAQVQKALKRSKQDTTIHQAGGSSEGADSKLKVPDETKDEVDEQSDDERTESDDKQTEADNPRTSDEEEETQEDECPTNKEKGDEEMNNTKTVDAEHENVYQGGAGNQVKDDAHVTQKTEGPIPSSFISFDYAAKYLNFDNIPPVDTEVVSMLDVNVQHEVLRTSQLLSIPVSVIPEHNVINPPETVTTASTTTISSLLSSLFPYLHAQASHKAKNIVSTTRCLVLLHMDLFGPSIVRSYRGNRYTLVIVYDYSRYTWTSFLKDKTEAFDQFEIFSKKIQKQLGCTIVSIRTYHGREFDNELKCKQDIAISELKKLIENCKGKSVETQFDKPSVVRQPNAQRIPKPSVLGKPTPFSNSPKMRSFQTKQSVNKTNVSDGLFKQVTQQNLPQIRKQAVRNTNVIAPSPSRNNPKHVSFQSPKEFVGSNDMVHNYYLEKAKKSAQLQKDENVNRKPSMIDPARLPNTANVCKPKPRNWQASMSSRISNKDVHLGEHRKQKPFLKFNALQCPTCKKCLYSANHDECVLEYLSKLNPRASAQNKDAKSHNTTKRYVPVEKTSESKKPERQIPKGHRFQLESYSTSHVQGEKEPHMVQNGRISLYTCMQTNTGLECQICLGVDLEPDEWIKDSGCSKHITSNQKLFSSYKAYNRDNVIFGSNLRGNIIGKGQICDNKCRVTFSEHDSEITKDGKVTGYSQNSKAYIILNKHTRKVEESHNVAFDGTPPPSKTSPLVDDDLDEEEAVKVTEKKNLENDIEDETLEIDKIVNNKESRNHPLENVIGNLNQRTLRSQAQNQFARLESIRILLAYACALDFKLFQMDVKSAFLNGFINEEVYVAQPDHVYKLKKALYGLKQAPKAWYDRLKAFLIKHEYKMGMVDNTLFTQKESSNLIIVQIYVDDIIFGSTCEDMCDEFAKIMHDEFEKSMMCELNFFLGLQIKQMEDGIFFNQSKYIKEMLKKFGLEESKPMKTPMSSDTKLTKDKECESVYSTKYRGMIGTLHLGLWYPKGIGIETVVYADSDHAGDYVDRKSTSGICTFVGCCLTSWFSKKQTALAISTTKAEYKQTALAISTTEAKYVSAGKACQQALWMKQALIDYDVRLDDVPIMCDNKGAIDLSKNPVQHSRTKHIKIRHHFLRDNVQKGHISIEKVPSVDNIADILTKPLKRESFNYLRLGLGMMEHIP